MLDFIEKSYIKDGPIFIHSDGSVFENAYITKKFMKIADEADVDRKKVNLHSFRNLYIDNELQNTKHKQEELEDEYEEE